MESFPDVGRLAVDSSASIGVIIISRKCTSLLLVIISCVNCIWVSKELSLSKIKGMSDGLERTSVINVLGVEF
jgi:hypothetical protein